MTKQLFRVGLAAALISGAACSNSPEGAGRQVIRVSRAERSPLSDCAEDGRPPQAGVAYESAEVEGHLAADPGRDEHLVAAWQQDRWNNGAARGIVAAVSDDGGRTWTESGDTRTSLCTGGTTANGGGYRRVTDPWVALGPDGAAYLATLSVDPDAASPFGVNPDAILVARSDDGGMSWDDPVTLVRDTDPTIHNDKPSITADPYRPGTAYAAWGTLTNDNEVISGVTSFSSSVDGGRTWEKPRIVYEPEGVGSTLGSQVLVLPHAGRLRGGLVMVATVVSTEVDTRTYSFRLVATAAADRKSRWSEPSTIAAPEPKEAIDPISGDTIVSGRLLPDGAVDPQTGSVYVVWLDSPRGAKYNRVFLSSSSDGGRSWTPPVPVNRTPSGIPVPNRQVLLPAVHVLADGTVGVTYLDLRNNGRDGTAGRLETDAFLAFCRPQRDGDACVRGDGWAEKRITAESFDFRDAPITQGPFVGDYMGLSGNDDFLSLIGIVDAPAEVTQHFVRISPDA
ncbi:MAG TPA: sialidase family protein [Actinomycetota bacterium]|nr:sialidase family protein [Actinomycetota bacterium]